MRMTSGSGTYFPRIDSIFADYQPINNCTNRSSLPREGPAKHGNARSYRITEHLLFKYYSKETKHERMTIR